MSALKFVEKWEYFHSRGGFVNRIHLCDDTNFHQGNFHTDYYSCRQNFPDCTLDIKSAHKFKKSSHHLHSYPPTEQRSKKKDQLHWTYVSIITQRRPFCTCMYSNELKQFFKMNLSLTHVFTQVILPTCTLRCERATYLCLWVDLIFYTRVCINRTKFVS